MFFDEDVINTDASLYVVFDVETNGLKSKEDDLLSISFYKPDDDTFYNRFLPLELAKKVKTTEYNGIRTEDLVGLEPLSQSEFDKLIESFELDKRTILTYSGGGFDERFLREYLHRKRIYGFDRLKFYNFKKQLISSRFSGGNVTKDNLCLLFGIKNVQKVHSGINDCKLEWELFKKLNGHYYLITEGEKGDNVFRMSPDYIIPVSFFSYYHNMDRLINNRPYIVCESSELERFEIDATGLKKFETNFNGMIIEHLIDTMLGVQEIDSRDFLLKNKSKLEYIGYIPSPYNKVPMVFNPDGTVTAVHREDKKRERELNNEMTILRDNLVPLVEYIRNVIFQGKSIKSQELVVNKEYNILALCDLSSDDAVLEIKTNNGDTSLYKEQLFYEANGRRCYHLKIDWQIDLRTGKLERVCFIICEVNTTIGEPPTRGWNQKRRDAQREIALKKIKANLSPLSIELVNYYDSLHPIRVKCLVCGSEWETYYTKAIKGSPKCEVCHPKVESVRVKNINNYISKEERLKIKEEKYAARIDEISNGKITISNYEGSDKKVKAYCKICGFTWTTRADHLLARCTCKQCKRNEKTNRE